MFAMRMLQIVQVLSAALYSHNSSDDAHGDTAAGTYYSSPFTRPRRYVFPMKQACLAFVLVAIGITMTAVGITQGSFRE